MNEDKGRARPVVVLTGTSRVARRVAEHYAAAFAHGELLVVEERASLAGKLAKFARRRLKQRGLLSVLDAVILRALLFLGDFRRERRPAPPALIVEDVNDERLARFVARHDSRLVILNLCSLLSAEQLGRIACPVINVHPGIAPRYRGAGNIWALYEGNLDLVGATVHLVDPGIDTGEPLAYARLDPIGDSIQFDAVDEAAQLKGAALAIAFARGERLPQKPPEFAGLPSRFYPYPGLSTWLVARRNYRRRRAEARAMSRA